MWGSERTRFCQQCSQRVYNISKMSRAEAETLIGEKDGRLCIRLYRRADGTVITKDCGKDKLTAKQLLLAMCVLFLTLGFSLIGMHRSQNVKETSQLRKTEPFKTVLDWVYPAPQAAFGTAGTGICTVGS